MTENETVKHYAVVGYPLEHTLSPALHKKLFDITGKAAEYTSIQVRPEEFESRVQELFSLDGFNVTMPYKLAIIPYLDKMTSEAMRFRAVNTVSCVRGVKTGYNTDIEGVKKSFELIGGSFRSNICILGAGGAASMIAAQAITKGGAVTIAVRKGSEKRGEELISSIKLLVLAPKLKLAYMDELTDSFDMLINATPCGMYPDIDACPVADSVIKNSARVFDLIYNPAKTALLHKAEEYAKPATGGLAMLVWQAVYAHEYWYNAKFSREQVEKVIDEMRTIL